MLTYGFREQCCSLGWVLMPRQGWDVAAMSPQRARGGLGHELKEEKLLGDAQWADRSCLCCGLDWLHAGPRHTLSIPGFLQC